MATRSRFAGTFAQEGDYALRPLHRPRIIRANLKKVTLVKRKSRKHLREVRLKTTREVVMARLARKIGRGHDAIYHGTRYLPTVLRAEKLKPCQENEGVYFTRSPEVASYWALFWGLQFENYSGGVLVIDRASLTHSYRLVPSRWDKDWWDEREEHVWRRQISFRRHLSGVVSEADVYSIIGAPKQRFLPNDFYGMPEAERQAFWDEVTRPAHTLTEDGRAKVREIIIQERAHRAWRSRPERARNDMI